MIVPLIILFILVFISNVKTQNDSLLCVSKQHAVKRDIRNVEYQSETVNCIKRLEHGIVKFTVATPDEALLSSTFTTENTTVAGYFGSVGIDFDTRSSTIVLTKGKQTLNFARGLKYCHPGVGANVPPSMSYELLKEILRRNNPNLCQDTQLTIPEYFYHHLNLTLGPSCIAGQWTADGSLDAILKKRFPKLVEVCQKYDKDLNPFEQSLKCLTDGIGDIALTSIQELEQAKSKMSSTNVVYLSLCKNDSFQHLENPCVWSKQSWPLLLAHKDQAGLLRKAQDTLEELSYGYITPLSNNTLLSSYVQNFREIPAIDDKIICDRGLVWCTLTEEETEYCNLLRHSFLIYGIQPAIKLCKKLNVEHLDKYECIESFSKGTSISFLESDQLYSAKKAQLEIVAYASNEKQDLVRSVLIVNATAIQSKEDLQNKRACFSEFGSIDWLSFVATHSDNILQTSCFYDEELSKFVGDSCMPGVRDPLRKAKANIKFERACKICEASYISATAVNCNANRTENVFATSEGALHCLSIGAGEYAVVKIGNNEIATNSISENITVMCKNGTLLPFTENLDEDCYLSLSPSGAIVTKENTTARDIRLVFMELNKLASNITMFPLNPFSDVDNPLFGSAKSFYDVESCNNNAENNENCKYIEKLSVLLENVDTCTKSFKNNAEQGSISSVVIVVIVLIVFGVLIGVYFGYKHWKARSEEGTDLSNQDHDENEAETLPLKTLSES